MHADSSCKSLAQPLRTTTVALLCVAEALAPTPEIMQRVLADADLLAGYDDAEVMAAVADIAAHPQHAARHMANPKVSHGRSQKEVLRWMQDTKRARLFELTLTSMSSARLLLLLASVELLVPPRWQRSTATCSGLRSGNASSPAADDSDACCS